LSRREGLEKRRKDDSEGRVDGKEKKKRRKERRLRV
jgi:hypothetical protein